MSRAIDLTGQKFGKLTALERVQEPTKRGKHARWKCVCECGNYTYVTSNHLKKGDTKTCGCHKHNKSGTRLYNIWKHMNDRCSNSKNDCFHNYGGRGITVCEEWRDDFEAFKDWAIANGYQDDLTIDRINNDGNYEPSNCRWATYKEQHNNTRANHMLTYNGKTQTIAQWAEETGIKQNTLIYRIRRGWSVERAINEKVNSK